MRTLECTFYSIDDDTNEHRPYVSEVFEYNIQEGFLVFDGYFRVSDDKFPLIYHMFLHKAEEKPYKIENDINYFHNEFEACYRIKIHTCERLEDTSVISEIEEDGETMYVCFTPTERIRIGFEVLEK